MAKKIAARLSRTGTLYANTSVLFNEISQNNTSIAPSGVYAAVLDEVTGTTNGSAMQQTPAGVIKITGVFDEVSGIA